jgi:tetratricopeptide (TPR) repeat protein
MRGRGDYAAAIGAALALLEATRTASAPVAWQVERLEHLVHTLESVKDRSSEEQARLAEVDRLLLEQRAAFDREEPAAALEIARQRLPVPSEIPDDDHLEVAATQCDIGLYHDRSWTELDAGEAAYQRCLAIRREKLSPDHPDVAAALQLLGTMLRRRDNWVESEALMREGLEIRRPVLGEDHLDTACSMHHSAFLLVRFRKYDEAQELYEKALEARREQLTYVSRLLPENLVALGLVHGVRGEHAEAEAYYREALDLTCEGV